MSLVRSTFELVFPVPEYRYFVLTMKFKESINNAPKEELEEHKNHQESTFKQNLIFSGNFDGGKFMFL